jgi:hypothetical protein
MQAQELLEFLVKNGDIPPERRKELASLIKKPALDENIDANEIEEGNQAEGPSTADPFSRLVDSNLIQKGLLQKLLLKSNIMQQNSRTKTQDVLWGVTRGL